MMEDSFSLENINHVSWTFRLTFEAYIEAHLSFKGDPANKNLYTEEMSKEMSRKSEIQKVKNNTNLCWGREAESETCIYHSFH